MTTSSGLSASPYGEPPPWPDDYLRFPRTITVYICMNCGSHTEVEAAEKRPRHPDSIGQCSCPACERGRLWGPYQLTLPPEA